MKVIGFLPLRAGSKSIPHKNTKEFLGKPLYKWALEAMIQSDLFSEIWVSTDDPIIISIEEKNPKVKIHYRSQVVSCDSASTESVIDEFLKGRSYSKEDIFILVQATNPFVTKIDFQNAISDFIKYSICTEDHDISMASVVENHRFVWKKEYDSIEAINYQPCSRQRRQDIHGNELYIENGAFYISFVSNVKKLHCRLTHEVLPYIMGQESYHEIDEPVDFIICEAIRKHLDEVGKRKS
jgi:CMP-N-acetylneuraminic acid synthetase